MVSTIRHSDSLMRFSKVDHVVTNGFSLFAHHELYERKEKRKHGDDF